MLNQTQMKTNQPIWKYRFNLGDNSPIDHGGLFVYEDANGVYSPEVAKLIAPDGDNGKWTEYRFILEPLTAETITTEWFYDDLADVADVADFIGSTADEMIADLIGDDLRAKTYAWEAIGYYHGFDNLDSYPLKHTRAEVEQRFWFESGEKHPPSGTKYENFKMSYSIAREEYTQYPYGGLRDSCGLQNMTFGKYGQTWDALIALGQSF